MSSKKPENTPILLPRMIRMKDAPFYLGVNKNYFNSEIRPFLTELKIGVQGIAFDRLDLDAWVDEMKSRMAKPANTIMEQNKLWDAKKSPASSNAARSGTSTKLSKEDAFAKALAQATSKKPKIS